MFSTTQLGAAHLVAAALGRSLGVQVVVSNVPTACTDGKTIYLPPLPVQVDEQLAVLLWGFIHHEAGHCRHTDFSIGEHMKAENDELLVVLCNVFEDTRMELEHMRLYPGAHQILCELVDVLVKIGFYEPPSPDSSAASLTVGFINKYCRVNLLNQPGLADQATQHRKMLEQTLGNGFVTRLLAITQQVLDCTSTEDVLNLSYRVREFIQEEERQSQEQKQQAQASPANATPPGSSTSQQASADSDNVPDPSTPSTDSDSCGDSDGATTGNQVDGSDAEDAPSGLSGAGRSEDSGTSQDRADFLDQLLSGTGLGAETDDLGNALADVIGTEAANAEGDSMVLPTTLTSSGSARDDEAVQAAQQVSSNLAIQLKRQLESSKRLPSSPKTIGRRVSRRHLHRVAFKDYRVFHRPIIQTAMNTSVVCLLDASSSMNHRSGGRKPIEIARESLLATSMALSSIRNLKACAAAFPAGTRGDKVELLSAFEEKPANVSSRFCLSGRGSTPMAEAILWAGNQLTLRPDDERKILLVATDGAPDRPELTAQVIHMVEKTGIEVYGLGIESDDSHDLFRYFAVVDDVSQLCEAYLKLFRNVLTRKSA